MPGGDGLDEQLMVLHRRAEDAWQVFELDRSHAGAQKTVFQENTDGRRAEG